MKRWVTGLLLLGIAIPLITSQDLGDNDEEYEVKRFHVQSRQLNGSPQCIETRRKRSPRQIDGGSQTSNEQDDEEDSMDQEMGISTGSGDEQLESTGLLIRDSDLAGNAGILVIQNGVSPNSPVLFELRPVATDAKDAYFEVVDENNSNDPDDPDFVDDTDDMEYNDNRYKPNSDLDSSEDEETSPPRRRIRPTQKPKRKRPSNQFEAENSDEDVPSKKRPKRPSSKPPRNQRKPSRKKNSNKNKKKKKKSSKRKGSNSQPSENNRKQFRKRLNMNKNKRLGLKINKGSGVRTVTHTVTTTDTGPGDGDVNCIIINKPAAPVVQPQRPFWDILGRSTGDRQQDRSFGLRKRIMQRLF